MASTYKEAPEQLQKRKISHYIAYYTIARTSLFYSAMLVSLWPYLNKLDNHADKTFLGYLAGISALSSTLLCPLFGKWSDLTTRKSLPFLFNLFCGVFYYILYITLPIFTTGAVRYWFLCARILAGMNDVNIALSRCYIAEATLNGERRRAVAIVTGCQTIALAGGPALQSLLVPLGESGFWIIPNFIKFDMYSSIGWLGLISTLINIILFHPSIFQSSDLRHAEEEQKTRVEDNKYFKTLAWLYIILHFILVVYYLFLKVLGTPIVMDEFAMTRQDALGYNSYVVSASALSSLVAIFVMDYFCKKWGETKVMYLGFLIEIVGRLLMYPLGSSTIQIAANQTDIGCPTWVQSWCPNEKQMFKSQFIASNILEGFGYSWAVTIIFTKFSHILGHRHQGIWMGFMSSLSGIARIVGPIILSNLYAAHGNATSVIVVHVVYIPITILILWLIYYFSKRGSCPVIPADKVLYSLVKQYDHDTEIVDK